MCACLISRHLPMPIARGRYSLWLITERYRFALRAGVFEFRIGIVKFVFLCGRNCRIHTATLTIVVQRRILSDFLIFRQKITDAVTQ
jgi:hypothetical protein